MHVLIHLSKYYDWQPVPADVQVTDQDVAAGLVVPGREPGAWRMRVAKVPPGGSTHRFAAISETMIHAKIVEERCDIRRGGRIFTRKQALAAAVAEHVLSSGPVQEAEPAWITGFDVHDDLGPQEADFRAHLEPHHVAIHARRGGPHIHRDDLEKHVAAYMESAGPQELVDHLHSHFSVPKPQPTTPSVAPKKASK